MSLFVTLLPLIKTGAVSTISRLASLQISKLITNPNAAKTFEKAYNKALSLHEKGEEANIFSNSYTIDVLERIAEIDTLNTDDESKRFLKLLAFELLQNDETKNFVLNFQLNEVLTKLASIENELKINTSYNHFSFIESAIDVFIPRNLTKISLGDKNEERRMLSHEQYSSMINDNKLIVILANAGMGKSTLLKQIANYIAKDGSYYPVFINLNSYSADQPLSQYIENRHPQITKIQQSELVFILDGFDEIGTANDVKKIHDFKEVYKGSSIILSSRYSHYKNTLNGFQQYHLNDINIEDINSYITEKFPTIDLYSFMQEVKRVGIDKLIYNPFFLNIILQYYIGNNSKLPNDKQSLIHGLLKERLLLDKEHFRGINIDDELITIESNTRRLSLIMAMMNKRAINEKELQFVLQSSDDLLKLKSAIPIKKDSEGIWSFEHAIFLENFASEALSCIEDFEDLRTIISYKDSQIIIDEWTNIVGYLVGILDISSDIYKRLINWLTQHNPTVIVKIETDKLTINERDNLLKNIFLYHKEKTTWIDRDVEYSLAQCEYSKELIKFLYEEVCNLSNHRRVRLNGIGLLKKINLVNLENSERKAFVKMLTQTIRDLQNEDTEQISDYLNLVAPLDLQDEEIVKELIFMLKHRNSMNIAMAICNLIYQWKQSDIHFEYIRDITKKVISNNGYAKEKEDSVKHYSATYTLQNVISEIKKTQNIAYLLDLYTEDNYGRSNSKELLKVILNRAEILFDDILYYSFFDLYHKRGWLLLENETLIEFIRKMNLGTRILYDIFEKLRSGKKEYCRTDILINNKEDVDACFKAYEEGIWKLWRIDNLYRSLQKDNEYLADYVLNQLLERYQHIPEIPRDHDKERMQRNQKSFDILLDIPRFKAECLKVFDSRGVDIISYKDIFEYKFKEKNILPYEDFENSYNHAVGTRFRMHKDDDGNITRESIISYFNDEDMELHQIAHIYDKLIGGDRNKELTISPTQFEYLEDWFSRYIDKTCFIDALTYNGGNSYSFNRIAVILIGFLKRFNFDCPIDKLEEMTYLAWDSDRHANIDSGFLRLSYLEERLGVEKLTKQVLENIQKGVDDRPLIIVLENHLCYVLERKLEDYYQIVLNILLEPNLDIHKIDRILNVWFDSDIKIDMLIDSLDIFPIYNQLTICQKAFKLGLYEQISDRVKQLVYDLEDDRYTSALMLMLKAKDLRGIEIYTNNTQLKKSFPIGRFDARDILIYEDIKALPYYMQLLELSWDKSIKNSTDMKGLIIQALKNLGIMSADNCKSTIESVNVFMQKHSNDLDDVMYLNDLLDSLNHFLLRSTYQAPFIKGAISIVDKVNKEWHTFI